MSAPAPLSIALLLTPHFNMTATMGFIDPFRAANYLAGRTVARWDWLSEAGGPCPASNGATLATDPLGTTDRRDLALVSSSWTPEAHNSARLQAALWRWARQGAMLAGLDTGGFVLAEAGLLTHRRATVHYEHMDAFGELYPEVALTDALWVQDGPRLTCCGGAAAMDCALSLLADLVSPALAQEAARYLFHPGPRRSETAQNASATQDAQVPAPLRRAIATMETHLESPLPITEIAEACGLSHRQLNRLFQTHVGRTAQLYYRDIRLDRARGLVTQTDLPLAEVALAAGFASQVHFSRAYRDRFGLQPRKDRTEGRVPFEYRPWPMHSRPRDVARGSKPVE